MTVWIRFSRPPAPVNEHPRFALEFPTLLLRSAFVPLVAHGGLAGGERGRKWVNGPKNNCFSFPRPPLARFPLPAQIEREEARAPKMRNLAGNLAQRNYSSRRPFVIVMKPRRVTSLPKRDEEGWRQRPLT